MPEVAPAAPALDVTTSAEATTKKAWKRRRRVWRRLITPLAIVALWQLASSVGWLDPRTLASPETVLTTGWDLLATGVLHEAMWVSLGRVVRGLAIGVATGVVLALIAGLSSWGEDLVDAPMQMIRTAPIIALVPLFILWFGIGETPKVLLIALGTTFPVYMNTFAGIRAIDKSLVDAAKTLGLSHAQTILHVILPGALPSFLVGLRFSLGVSWLLLVVSEQVNATKGIGAVMMQANESFRTDIMVVVLVVYALLGLLSDLIVRSLEHVALAWRPKFVTA